MDILPIPHAHKPPGTLLLSEMDIVYCFEGSGDHIPREVWPLSNTLSDRGYLEGLIVQAYIR